MEFLSVLDLPWEDVLVCHVLPKLSFVDLLSLRQTCTCFKRLVDDHLKVQKCVKSWRAILLDTPKLMMIPKLTGKISRLDLSYCSVNTDVVRLFLEYNPCVTHINLSGSKKIGEPAFLPLIKSQLLRQLIAVECDWVTIDFLLTIAYLSPHIEFINLRGVLIDLQECARRFWMARLPAKKPLDKSMSVEFSFSGHTLFYRNRLERLPGFRNELVTEPTGGWIT